MTMNSSGPISLGGATVGQSINLENGFSATAQVSLNDTAVRNLAGVASGAITMPTNFYGKANRASISYTFSSSTANASLNLSAISGYSSGKSDITVTINAGVYLYSTSTGSYGLTLSGATTGDTAVLVNNGYIMGQGGNGAAYNITSATAGGPAMDVSSIGISSITITNTSGYIGGGGGGGGRSNSAGSPIPGGGGGAGGGAGGAGTTKIAASGGGGGGSIGSAGGNGGANSGSAIAGGGGGRILPGTGGPAVTGYFQTASGGGAGGAGGCDGGYGGAAGGSAGNAGGNGPSYYTAGGGAGWGASGGSGYTPYGGTGLAGAAGGKAINTGGKSITWTGGSASSSRAYGAVS